MPPSDTGPGKRSANLDFERADPARMYAFYLGNEKDATAADRQAARRVIERAPDAPAVARENFKFAARGATWAVKARGIRQVFDIGVGIVEDVKDDDGIHLASVEQAVRGVAPDAVTLAFDNSPTVLARARALRPGYGGVLEGDVRDLDSILGHRGLRVLGVDLAEPVAVVLAAVLHFVPDPAACTAGLADRLAPGSVLILSLACSTNAEANAAGIAEDYKASSSGIHFRTAGEVRALAPPPWKVVDPPGLVDVARWDVPGPRTEGQEGEDVRVLGMAAVLGERR
jgi:hypothetical protein